MPGRGGKGRAGIKVQEAQIGKAVRDSFPKS